MECLFLTGQRLFISVSVCVAGQPQTLVPMACLYLVSINVHRPRWPCSVSVSAHPRPQLRSSGHLLLALGARPCGPGPRGGSGSGTPREPGLRASEQA